MFSLNKEAAVIIGIVISVLSALITQLSGPGIFTDDLAQTVINVVTIVAPLIAGAITRYQVYSKSTVAALTGTSVSNLPPPP
jgi:hypothetical protein